MIATAGRSGSKWYGQILVKCGDRYQPMTQLETAHDTMEAAVREAEDVKARRTRRDPPS